MSRYFLKLAYNGKNYHGWQSQPNASSIQQTLEEAIRLIWKSPVEIVGAGRTDAGVHAKTMYAHFDFEAALEPEHWVKKLNAYLPKDIVIYDVIPVHAEAHARFDASSRSYEYHLHQYKNPFEQEISWYFFHPLQLDKMNEACDILLQYTDFECFSKTHTDVNTFNCKITEARWVKQGDKLVFHISADRFLRNMVRAIVGTMIDIGLGKNSPEHLHHIIQSKNRSEAGFSVPAHGLFLTEINYPYLP
ncbi:MAG: tRNA pseudouridine(38-40) synthase TruA [Flavobacterium sp.]